MMVFRVRCFSNRSFNLRTISAMTIGTFFLFGCKKKEPPLSDLEVLAKIEGSVFPILENHRVEAYFVVGFMEGLVYEEGAFASDQLGLRYTRRRPIRSLDSDSKAIIKKISLELEFAPKIREITKVRTNESGKVTYAKFHSKKNAPARHCYVYDIGYSKLPEDQIRQKFHYQINENWYYFDEDWN